MASRHLKKRSTALTLVRALGHWQAPKLIHCADKKCPFTGEISIRGRILTGKVVSTKMTRTVIIRRDYLHYIPKYSAWTAQMWWMDS